MVILTVKMSVRTVVISLVVVMGSFSEALKSVMMATKSSRTNVLIAVQFPSAAMVSYTATWVKSVMIRINRAETVVASTVGSRAVVMVSYSRAKNVMMGTSVMKMDVPTTVV